VVGAASESAEAGSAQQSGPGSVGNGDLELLRAQVAEKTREAMEHRAKLALVTSQLAEHEMANSVLASLANRGCIRPDVVLAFLKGTDRLKTGEDGKPVGSLNGRQVGVDELIDCTKRDLLPELFRSGPGAPSPGAGTGTRPVTRYDHYAAALAAIR